MTRTLKGMTNIEVDTGAKLEHKFQSYLKDIPCYSHKFTDFKTLSMMIARYPFLANRIPKAPCDRLVVYKGISFFFELKSTEQESLSFNNIKDHQVGALLNHEKKGNGKSFFVINFSRDMYIIDVKDIAAYIMDSERKSIPKSFCIEKGIKICNTVDLQGVLDHALE